MTMVPTLTIWETGKSSDSPQSLGFAGNEGETIVSPEFVEIEAFDASGQILAVASFAADRQWRCRLISKDTGWIVVGGYNSAIDWLTDRGACRTVHLTQEDMTARFVLSESERSDWDRVNDGERFDGLG